VGTTPGQTAGITEPIPDPDDLPEEDRDTAKRAQKHMRVEPGGDTMEGTTSTWRSSARVLTRG